LQLAPQYRSLQKNKTDDEIARVNANPQMWHVQNVLHYLHAIVDKSNINPQLIAFREGTDIDTVCWTVR
jgi:translation initiation factor 3 subunit L